MDWTYKSGANGSATSLLSTYANGSDAKYNYDYDANGNITRIWRGNTSFGNASEKYSYVYDSANQLVRENLYYGSGNSSNATITYEYDIWGNLLNKKIYAYTVGTLGTARETVSYAYTNSAWKDQLTSYDGESITYDASGNPTNYLGATLVWEGQRLKSYTPKAASSGRANSYVYSYDENGIRTRKTIGNTVTDYYYNGTLLMGTVKTTTNSDGSTTTSKLRFSYDANGKVVAVNYNGNYYYYLRNAQSDIVKLIDKTGETVVEYRYDSWGKLLSTSGSLASTLGKNNPFRYRGYVYDEETGFYYLRSRYYDPEVRRFISADVLLSTGQGVLGHNAYAYCLNSPIIRVDLDGDFGGLILGAIVGAVVNAAVNIASTIASNAIEKKDLSLTEIVTVGLLGAAEGALSVLCPGASVIIGASFGAANSIASGIIRKEPFGSIVGDTIISVGFGALGGAMSGGDTINTRLLDKGLDARKLLKKSAAKKLTKCAQNAAVAADKRAKVYLLKEFGSGAAESIGMSFLSWFTNKRIKFIVKNMGLPSLPGGEQ